MVEVSRRDLRIYDEVSLELSLAQLKYLNPLSLLAFIGITMVSATVASPTEAEISDQYLTILTPVVSVQIILHTKFLDSKVDC